ncbi:acyltransferase family protein [Cohnella mopanensis]|uniref:acyltransferase family protein n=1 Tax=Cohnella mopanensis TaxID=2911966 RepID=UPI001EF91B82|nr:acyltransferase family protein [Cohnella mopanensis]
MRIYYLDRLKLFMTVLVILHHAAITYGGAGSWYYYEQHDNDLIDVLLSLFTIVNQSFFMGLFFFISGYMTPASYDRKKGIRFMRDRLIRLGIPILVFMIVADPLLRYVATGYNGSIGDYFATKVMAHPFLGLTEFHAGPLWYLVTLLLFSAGYACFRGLTRGRSLGHPFPLTSRIIVGYLAAVIIANYLVRMVIPVGETVLSLQLAYFPAYIGLFMGGIAAYRGKWLESLSESLFRRWRVVSILLIISLPIGFIVGGALSEGTSSFEGGLTWQSAFYSAVDPILGIGLSYVLLAWFHKRWNQSPTGSFLWLSNNALLVYIIHAIVLTFVSYGLRHLVWHPLLKFVLASCIVVPLCFAIAWSIRRIPGVRKVV